MRKKNKYPRQRRIALMRRLSNAKRTIELKTSFISVLQQQNRWLLDALLDKHKEI